MCARRSASVSGAARSSWPPHRPPPRPAIAGGGSTDLGRDRRRFVAGGKWRREAERYESGQRSRVLTHKTPFDRYICGSQRTGAVKLFMDRAMFMDSNRSILDRNHIITRLLCFLGPFMETARDALRAR
jgi:hypothetical protein